MNSPCSTILQVVGLRRWMVKKALSDFGSRMSDCGISESRNPGGLRTPMDRDEDAQSPGHGPSTSSGQAMAGRGPGATIATALRTYVETGTLPPLPDEIVADG